MIGYSAGHKHLFISDPPAGRLSPLLVARTEAYVLPRDVPLWDKESRNFGMGTLKCLCELKFRDLVFAGDQPIIRPIVDWLEGIHDELRNLGVAEYVYTNGYAMPTDTDCIQPFFLMQEQIATNIKQGFKQCTLRSSHAPPHSDSPTHHVRCPPIDLTSPYCTTLHFACACLPSARLL